MMNEKKIEMKQKGEILLIIPEPCILVGWCKVNLIEIYATTYHSNRLENLEFNYE